jgi:predicted RND superfamily exporter protein
MSVLRRAGTSLIDGWIGLAVTRPVLMLGIWFLLLGLASAGLVRLRVETSGESILDKSDDAWAFYQKSLERFGNDEVIVAAVAAQTPYDVTALRTVAEASRALEAAPDVRRVDSLSTLPIIEVVGGNELRLDPALDPDVAPDAGTPAAVERRVRGDRIAGRSVVSDDGRVLAINIWPESGIAERYEQLVERIRGTLAAPNVWVSGVPVFRTETNLRTRHELGVFFPVTIAVMVLLLFGAFQSARAVVVPLTVSGVSVAVLGGAMGWADVPISAPTMILPPVLLAIGCAYAMHMLTEVDHQGTVAELESALVEVSRPIALSGVTTTIGFASTAIVPIEAVQRVGVLGALGTLIACAATVGLGGAIVSLWPGRLGENPLLGWLRNRLTPWLLSRIRQRANLAIGFWMAVLGLGVVAAQRLHVESDVVVWFPRGTEVRDAYEEIKARLSGISPLNVVVEATNGGSVSEPQVVDAIDRLSGYLASQPEVGKVLSVADPLHELHEGFTGRAGAALPTDRAAIEQYLLLLEGTRRLGDVITLDRSAANVLLRVNNNGSRHLLDVADRAEAWWREHGVPGYEAHATGAMFEVARAEESIALGQIQGLGMDVAVIALILLLALRSLRLAVLSLVPNVIPIGLMFGFMGASGIPLDLGTVFVSNLAVGIAVDETIHLVTAFARLRGQGRSAVEALQSAMQMVLPALILTTVVIATGFLVLAVSDFRFTRNLGLLTAGVMVLCVASNASLLPALLLRFGGRDPIPATPRPVPPGASPT